MAQYSSLQSITPSGLYKNITVDTLIATGSGEAVGILVASHNAGTIKLWDNTSAATTVLLNTYTFPSGSTWIPLFGAKFLTGLYADVGGTVDLTIVYNV